MNNLIIGVIVYNEEKRFLKSFLDSISKLTNKIVIVDDGSTDNSLSICSKYTSNIYQTNRLYDKNEAELRKYLWDKTSLLADNGDFIFNSDADEIFTPNSLNYFEQYLYECNKLGGDSISWIKYDMWNETQYREEPPLWTASQRFWTWCVKYRKNYNYYWTDMKIHGGSVPINSYFCTLPTKLQIQHWAYSTLELRNEKVNFYKQYDPEAKFGNKKQYESILDKNPILIDFKDSFEDINE